MVTRFIYDKQIESQRLLNVYWSLAHGIYSSHGFYVLPYSVSGNPKVVYLPEFKGINTKKIVSDLSQYDRINIPLNNNLLIEYSEKIFKKINKFDQVNLTVTKDIENKWSSVEKIFEDYITNLFPSLRNLHLKLDIYWTKYGSLMSYNRPVVQGVLNQATIFLRDDMGVAQIVEGLLSSLLSQLFETRQMSWIQREILVDFLILDSNISHFTEDFVPTVLTANTNFTISKKVSDDAVKYLKRLGLDKQTLIESRNGMIYIHGLPSKTPFGQLEVKFLEILIKNTNEPVSYFDISDQIWPDNEDSFSLWALSQLAYKIKNKLRKNNISPEVVRNVRGVGYIFIPQS